jgi:hypothetical protein
MVFIAVCAYFTATIWRFCCFWCAEDFALYGAAATALGLSHAARVPRLRLLLDLAARDNPITVEACWRFQDS